MIRYEIDRRLAERFVTFDAAKELEEFLNEYKDGEVRIWALACAEHGPLVLVAAYHKNAPRDKWGYPLVEEKREFRACHHSITNYHIQRL